jgi:hypothetical protein
MASRAAALLWVAAALLSLPLAAEEPPPVAPAKLRELLLVHVADLEGAASTMSGGGLKLSAAFVPDALAYRAAKEYLRIVEGGLDHASAVRELAGKLAAWKREDGVPMVLLRVENQEPRGSGSGSTRRIYTIQKDFTGEAVSIAPAGGKPISMRLAAPPKNLRAAQVRVKRFWTTAPGYGRKGAADPDDPLSIGRKPKLSKPFSALLIEEKPVEAELLLKWKPAKGAPLPRIALSCVKRYEGPFEDDLLDLNGGRLWEAIASIEADLRPPPGGFETPQVLKRLIEEARSATKSR